jgi:glycosyltransferase involved in cell wall biosynthesis
MRVLLVSQEVPPETGWGGIGTYISTIAPALARAGAEVHVLSVVPGQPRSVVVRDGVQIHRAPLRRPRGLGRLVRMPLAWQRLSLAAAVRIEVGRMGLDFDVCESPEWNAEGLFLAGRRRTPCVVRLHSSGSQVLGYGKPPSRDLRAAERLEARLINSASAITGTRAQIEAVRSAVDGSEVVIREITYPVARAGAAGWDPAGEYRVLFAGRFEARKGPDVLLEAVP